jgi:hypothetical protein
MKEGREEKGEEKENGDKRRRENGQSLWLEQSNS